MELKVATQAWIAAALLHQNHPERPDFSVYEIRERAAEEFGRLRPGVYQHIVNHGLAQAAAAPAKLRLFTQTARGRRRLFRPGDEENPARKSGPTHPRADQLPEKYRPLLEWYEKDYLGVGSSPSGGESPSSPATFFRFIGLIPAYDLELMKRAIEESCERTDDEDEDEKIH